MAALSASHKRAADLTRCVEHGLQIESRSADDLQHVGRGCLLLKGFAQFAEQARVLDGDDGLSSEVLHQLNLFVGERPHFLAIYGDRANQLVLFEHWHRHKAPCAHGFDESNDAAVFPDVGLIGPEVGYVDNLFGVGDAVEWDSRMVAQFDNGIAPLIIGVPLRAVDRDSAKGITFEEPQMAERSLTDARCIRQHRIENRLQLAGELEMIFEAPRTSRSAALAPRSGRQCGCATR